MPGPPPKPAGTRRRRNADPVALVALPAAGRSGPPPSWPLPTGTADEGRLWATLWASPQATIWERCGLGRIVARYVRIVVAAEEPDATAATRAEARRLEETLGLSPAAMLRLRWTIVDGDPADRLDEPNDPTVDDLTLRRRAVDDLERRRRAVARSEHPTGRGSR